MSYFAPTNNQELLLFLRTWYGASTSPTAGAGGAHDAPRELVEWHDISAKWGDVITSHNYAIPLSELTVENGKVPFWVENQGTWIWAFDPSNDDDFVYEREPLDEPTSWECTGEKLSEFLIHATIVEAILGAPARRIAQGVRADWLQPQEGIHEFPYPAWNWPTRNSRIFFGENWLALVHPSGRSNAGHDITLASTTPEYLAWADQLEGIKWRSYSRIQDRTTNEPLPW